MNEKGVGIRKDDTKAKSTESRCRWSCDEGNSKGNEGHLCSTGTTTINNLEPGTGSEYVSSSHGFTIYIALFPLALLYVRYFFFSGDEVRFESKVAPISIFLCVLFAYPFMMAGLNMRLVVEGTNCNSLEDGWSSKSENHERSVTDFSVIRDLDVADVNAYMLSNS